MTLMAAEPSSPRHAKCPVPGLPHRPPNGRLGSGAILPGVINGAVCRCGCPTWTQSGERPPVLYFSLGCRRPCVPVMRVALPTGVGLDLALAVVQRQSTAFETRLI